MRAFYLDEFVLPLPVNHRFPMGKYAQVSRTVRENQIATLHTPRAATDAQILRCHTPEYLDKLKYGQLSEGEVRRIGFPWSPQLLERSRRSVGGTIDACHAALEDGIAVNLAGGTHHACSDHGEGFCVLNDTAIAARELQAQKLAQTVLIVDCDVHQGNGTAEVTDGDPSIFTFSIHGEKNFPYRKFPSDMDIGLPDDTGDADYLATLEENLWRALFLANADFAIYTSGADPYINDRLGKLALSKEGLAQRDQLVLDILRQEQLPIAVTMGGGYARDVNEIAAIHVQTVRTAAKFCRKS